MKIGFITDTNILRKNDGELNKEEKYLNNLDFFIEYIESLDKTSSDKKLIYFMPNIIVEELYHQKLLTYETRYKILKENYENISYGLIGEFPKCDIERILLEEKEKYINNDKITVLDLEYDKSIFEELTEDALRKNPPFDKSKEGYKTDSGYKDALIWKTIIYSKEIDECDRVYFFSGDKVFADNKEYLIEEFNKKHSNVELKIVFYKPDKEQRQNCLKYIIQDNNLIETEIIRLYDIDLILKNIKEIKYNYSEDVYYRTQDQNNKLEDVLFNDFEKNDFNIENVIEEKEKYQVLIQYRTEKYIISNDTITDKISRKILKGKIKLIFIKNKRKFELESYEIIYSKFATGLEETIQNLSNMLKTNIVLPNIELYNQSIKSSLTPLMESIKRLNSNLLDRELINEFINYTPLWMEELKNVSDSISYINGYIASHNEKIEKINDIKKISDKKQKEEKKSNRKRNDKKDK